MATAEKKPVTKKEVLQSIVKLSDNYYGWPAGNGATKYGVHWTLHDSHMRLLKSQESAACFADLPAQLKAHMSKDVRYVNYNPYFKGNDKISRDECVRYIELALRNRCIVGTTQTPDHILENGYTVDLLNPDVTIDKLYAGLCTLRYFADNRVFVKHLLMLCDAGFDYWVAYCLCHELLIGDTGHSWYPVCRGYSASGSTKFDVWQTKFTRDYFLLNKHQPIRPHAYTSLIREGSFAWRVAQYVRPPDRKSINLKSYDDFVEDMTTYVITEPVDYDTACQILKPDSGSKRKKKSAKVAEDDESEEFRVA